MKLASTVAIALLSASLACNHTPAPQRFGTAPSLTPLVEITEKSRVPLRLRVTISEPEHVAAFLVTPGSPTTMLYPTDSAGTAELTAGEHELETIYGHPAPQADTTGLLRRPAPDTTGRGGNNGGNNGGYNGGNRGMGGGGGRGAGGNYGTFYVVQAWVVVFASKAPFSFGTLQQKVNGISIPSDERAALSSVNLLIRDSETTKGPWSAMAVPFTP